jgi:hypothetical protein
VPNHTDAKLLQEAIDLYELHGGAKLIIKAGASDIPYTTLHNRIKTARLLGYKPSIKKDATRIYEKKRLGEVHMVIPDIQAKAGVPDDHLEWAANYAVEKRPDVIVQIGDWADMESLSSYDKGKRSYEGRRYVKDIDAANRSLNRFESVLERYNRENPKDQYHPRKVLTLGNHEYRIERATEIQPELHGKLSFDDFEFKSRGWEVHEFLSPVEISGIQYCHYFTSGVMGRPVSSAAALLRTRHQSCTQGHVQHTDIAIHPQTQHIALFCGTYYQHNEEYLGFQGNNQRRQIVMKFEVENGRYDPLFVSLKFLSKAYS